MITIKETREALTLYFMRQLTEDEARRANRPPRGKEDVPEWSTLDKNEADPDNHVDDYLDHLYGELQFNFMGHSNLVLKIMEEYGIVKLDVTSDQFRMIYREFIKTEVEVMKVILRRLTNDYSDEMRYLWSDDTGLSSPAAALCDLSEPRSNMFNDYIRQREMQEKQQKHSDEGASIRKLETQQKYAKFDMYVIQNSHLWAGKNGTWIAEKCKKETGVAASIQTLRKRVPCILEKIGKK